MDMDLTRRLRSLAKSELSDLFDFMASGMAASERFNPLDDDDDERSIDGGKAAPRNTTN